MVNTSIFNKNDLILLLEDNYTVRKNELKNYLDFIKEHYKKIDKTLEKSFILLLYANWEGFIKDSIKAYLYFISNRNIKLSKLKDNFHIINYKLILKDYSQDKSIEKEIILKNKICNISNTSFKLKIRDGDVNFFEKYIIAVESNLKYKKYKNISKIANYDIDDELGVLERNVGRLIHNRNAIAHTGKEALENTYIEIEDLILMYNSIVGEMERFKNYLQNNLADKKYLKL